ncbi:hypothetical protein LNO36_17790 [Klebsiella variicola subsp. variicola]|nr:hypothetical protein [Klebsiella variicola subsp. variicola]
MPPPLLWRKNLGIDVKLVNQEWKTFLDTRHTGHLRLGTRRLVRRL